MCRDGGAFVVTSWRNAAGKPIRGAKLACQQRRCQRRADCRGRIRGAMAGPVASEPAGNARARWARPQAAPFIAPALAVLCGINVLPLLWSIGASFFHFRADRLNT